MKCLTCDHESEDILCGICGFPITTHLAFDKEEVSLMRDHLVHEWIKRDHPYYHRAKEMFNKMHKFLEENK